MSKGPGRWRHASTSTAFALLTDHLGRRWALRVIWELREGALTFRGLQAACGQISPSVLQARLHELASLGVVEKIPRVGYRLSGAGEQLYLQLEPLADWAASHAEALN
jgi:DNA-binding HxlR family transcriptional regulator